MRKLTIRLFIALSTFILGIAATTVWFIHRQSSHQEVRLVIPNAGWETSFFQSLDEHAKGVNLSNLRTVVLPEGDLEVRLWYDALPYRIDGVILRRSGHQWSAAHLQGTPEQSGFQMRREALAAPKTGWESVWGKLVSAGILTLPDASEAQCHSGALDGVSYVVETNVNKTYRTYRYGNPQLMRCEEGRRIVEVGGIIEDEFGLWRSGRWE